MAKRKRKRFLKKMKKRLGVIVGLAIVVFIYLAGVIIYINVKEGDKYEQQVLTQQGYTSTVIPYRRGDILDANGNILATTEKVYNLILEPKNILEREESKNATIAALKKYFDFTDSQISDMLSDDTSYYEVAKKKLTYDDIKPFNEFCNSSEGSKVVGVYFEEEYKRIYPNNDLACHLLGFTVSGNVGMYGVEQSYNDYLNGYNGRRYSYLNDEYGLTETIEPPVNGNNIITCIDANVQSIVEDVVTEYMNTEGAQNVSVLVMNPDNCDVIALYNSHTFDLNEAYDIDATRYQFETEEEFQEFKKNATDDEKIEALNKLWRNFAISDVYEPGSTYKTFTISGALEDGVINYDDKLFCDGGEEKAGYFIQCHDYEYGGHGEITIPQALAGSCNDALMQIADKEGATIFDKYQILFGFGRSSGIDIPGEPDDESFSMVVYHENNLNVTELATSSFGQGVCVSMIQLGTAFCSVINGGNYYQPRVVKRIEDENGNIMENLDSVLVRKTISEEVSAEMREALKMVVEEGTGKRARVEGYDIGGKTGTAEKIPRNNGKYLLSFIGFAPVDDPQVVIYVVVDEPKVEDQSLSGAATKMFAAIAEKLFPYMNIYKNNDDFIDDTNIVDEQPTPIYNGDANNNDVAGGNDNPYVQDANGTDPSAEPDNPDSGDNSDSPDNPDNPGGTDNPGGSDNPAGSDNPDSTDNQQ